MTITAWRMYRRVRRLGPDLVHFHDPELIPIALLLSFEHPVFYDAHEDVPRQMLAKHWLPRWSRRLVARLLDVFERLASRRFAAVVAATPVIADRFPEDRRCLVRNYPIFAEFEGLQQTDQRDRPPDIGYVGVVADIRGAREMVAAVEAVNRECACTLKLAGNFSPPSLVSELQSMRGWQYVDYLGWLGRLEISRLLCGVRAGIVVLSPTENYLDALPVKLFEYMAAGLPVVASDFPGWRAIVKAHDCGLLVDPQDVGAISAAMIWLLSHPDEAQAMGDRGRMAVRENYQWANEAKQLEACYERLGF
jgi:glycosyltransferase involved in cell wall biosynthesis